MNARLCEMRLLYLSMVPCPRGGGPEIGISAWNNLNVSGRVEDAGGDASVWRDTESCGSYGVDGHPPAGINRDSWNGPCFLILLDS